MKKVLIKSLKLSNFKGIRKFEIADFNHGIAIYGDNASGKTTVFDAFNWLLFGKDSLNSAVFEIKTLRSDGEPIHNLEHSVEAHLVVDENPVLLKKIYREKYVKRRGESKKSFSGHTVDHFVDEVPCQQKEYNSMIGTICGEENFKLLTNPRFFNEHLHWTDRRRLLLEVCGDVDDQDVIASNSALAGLPDILGKRTIDDHRKIVNAKIGKINEQIEKIPTRIDERNQMIVPIDHTMIEIDAHIEDLKTRRKETQKNLDDINAGGGIPEKEKKLLELDNQAQKLKNALDVKISERQSEQRKHLGELEQAAITAANKLEKEVSKQLDQQDELKAKKIMVKKESEKRDLLRDKWVAKDAETFVAPEVEDTCPTCGKPYEKSEVDAVLAQAEKVFNLQKVRDLEKIGSEGKELGENIKRLEAEADVIAGELERLEQTIKDLVDKRDAAVKRYDDTKEKYQALDDDPPEKDEKLDEIMADADVIRFEINSLKSGNYEAVLAAENKLAEIEKDLAAFQTMKINYLENEKTKKRILELEAEEKRLSGEVEALEGELYIMDTFIRSKVAMLDEKIRAKFKYATFRMFTENINGGLEECCDTTFNGVPYNSMNNGARINVGLDICNTLSNHFGLSMPLFIDNSEAVTALFESDAQQIRLYVSDGDKQLRIEKI